MEILPDPTGFSAFESDCGFLGEPGELSSKNSRGSALGISPLRSLLAFFEESDFSAFALFLLILGGAARSSPLLESGTFFFPEPQPLSLELLSLLRGCPSRKFLRPFFMWSREALSGETGSAFTAEFEGTR